MPVTGQPFRRSQRLLCTADFKAVFDQPTVKASHHQGLLLARMNNDGTSRLGLIIAKKNVRNAVDRNRIKRIVREHFRQTSASHDHFDIVFLARRGLDKLDNQTMRALLTKLWQRLNSTDQQ